MNSTSLKNIVVTMLVILLMLTSIQGCTAAPIEVRGIPYDTGSTDSANISWDYSTFSGFTFPVNKYTNFISGCGEHIYFNDKGGDPVIGSANPTSHVIDEGKLVYAVKQYPEKFKVYSEETDVTKVGFYYLLPLFGKPYCAIDNDATNLAKILYRQTEDERRVLKVGETWNISGGYSLRLSEVDIDGNKCYFTLSKDGKELDSGVIATDGTNNEKIFIANATIGDGSENTYFLTFVDSVFASSEDNFAVFKYTWLLDKDKTLTINSGDEFGKFEVDEALETGINMSNKASISLNIDGETYFTDDWYFKVSDLGKGTKGGFVIYPAFIINPAEQTTASAQTVVPAMADNSSSQDKTVVVDMASADNAKEGQTASTAVDQKAPIQETMPLTSQKAPGFTVFTGIFMLLCIAFALRIN